MTVVAICLILALPNNNIIKWLMFTKQLLHVSTWSMWSQYNCSCWEVHSNASLSTWPSKEPSTTTTYHLMDNTTAHYLAVSAQEQSKVVIWYNTASAGNEPILTCTCYVKVYIILFSNSRSGDDNYSLKCIGHIDENIVAPGGSRWGWQRGQTMHLRDPHHR